MLAPLRGRFGDWCAVLIVATVLRGCLASSVVTGGGALSGLGRCVLAGTAGRLDRGRGAICLLVGSLAQGSLGRGALSGSALPARGGRLLCGRVLATPLRRLAGRAVFGLVLDSGLALAVVGAGVVALAGGRLLALGRRALALGGLGAVVGGLGLPAVRGLGGVGILLRREGGRRRRHEAERRQQEHESTDHAGPLGDAGEPCTRALGRARRCLARVLAVTSRAFPLQQ